MTSESASIEEALPWERAGRAAAPTVPHLVLAWSLDEPDRLGEAIAVEGRLALGRGDALADDPAPRAVPRRMRPDQVTACAPIAGARVARVHLLIEPHADGVRLTKLARAEVRINGRSTKDGIARPGDVVELHNAAVYLVVPRPTELSPLRSAKAPSFAFGAADSFGIVGESLAAWSLRDALAFAAGTNRHALLLGPSGVGKELAARAIHGLSDRAERTLVARNAATLPEALVDAELFGNAKNYPNPGMAERHGLIGEAHESTLFLDEIGDLPESAQTHLLRALDQGGEYQRLGEGKTRKSSFRLVAATNRPEHSLKHDFLARFTHRIALPAFGDRTEDVPLVMRELLRKIAADNPLIEHRFFERRAGKVAEAKIAPDFVVRLLRHPFSHHARELDRILWLAIGSAGDDFIGVTEAVEAELAEAEPASERAAEITRPELERALAEHGNSPTRLAKVLGLKNRFVLHRLLKKHGLDSGRENGGTS